MKKMAIVTPGFLPVPAVNGGAVETLITYLIEGNERDPHYEFTVFTCADERLSSFNYKYTKIEQISNTGLRRWIARIRHGFVKYFHIGHELSAYAQYLKHVAWDEYDDILVENSMHLYELLVGIDACEGKLSYHMHNDVEDETGDKSPYRTRLVYDTCKNFLVVSEYIKNRVIETVGGSR